jgi:hypothetical protein
MNEEEDIRISKYEYDRLKKKLNPVQYNTGFIRYFYGKVIEIAYVPENKSEEELKELL